MVVVPVVNRRTVTTKPRCNNVHACMLVTQRSQGISS